MPFSITQNAFLFRVFDGYFADNPSFFDTAAQVSAGYVTSMTDILTSTDGYIPLDGSASNYSVEWLGYFVPSVSGSYTFYTESDDASYLWIGSTALSGYTTTNALVKNGSTHPMRLRSGTTELEAYRVYPIRIQFGENGGGDNCKVSFNVDSGTQTYDWSGNLISSVTLPADSGEGPLSLDRIHVVVDGTPGTTVSLGDLDVRGLIGSVAGNAISFDDFYGYVIPSLDLWIGGPWSWRPVSTVIKGNDPIVFGDNTDGTLGLATLANNITPQVSNQFPAGTKIASISFGSSHALGLTTDDRLFAWGNNYWGVLTGTEGNGTNNIYAPKDITSTLGGVGIVDYAAMYESCFLVGSNGYLYGWGGNYNGQMMDSRTGELRYKTTTPTRLNSGSMANRTMVRVWGGYACVFALDSINNLHAWGFGSNGNLGNGTTNYVNTTPVNITSSGSLNGKQPIKELRSSTSHVSAIGSDGSLHQWATINGTNVLYPQSVTIPGGRSIKDIALGVNFTIALAADGTLWSWGASPNGELGRGTTSTNWSPTIVDGGSLSGKVVEKIACGKNHVIVVASDYTVHGWGLNTSNQLLPPPSDNQYTLPVQLTFV